MIDKILNNIEYVFGVLAVVLLALICYNLGSEAKTNKVCKQLNGVYVQTWGDGYTCIMATEIDIK